MFCFTLVLNPGGGGGGVLPEEFGGDVRPPLIKPLLFYNQIVQFSLLDQKIDSLFMT